MIHAIAVLALVSGALAQNLRASVLQSYSSSVMGSDGQLHSKMHKVITETSEDGLEKKKSETLCKDGNCRQHVNFIGRVPAFVSSMTPPSLYNSMPGTPEMRQRMAAMMDRLRHMHDQMKHHMHHYMKNVQHYVPPMREVHFLAPRGQETVDVTVPIGRIIMDAPVAMSATAPREASAGRFSDILLMGVCGALIAASFAIVMFLRTVLVGKVQAREMPFQALGQPLAPEAPAEQGLGQAREMPLQALGQSLAPEAPAEQGMAMETQASDGAKVPLRMYLQDLYNRAGAPRTEAELAAVLLRDVYMNTVEKAC